VSEPAGAGEQQEQARRTRKAWIVGGAFAGPLPLSFSTVSAK